MSHQKHKFKGTIGVLTSGGDAPGMNAALRAVVRGGLAAGWCVSAIREGYQGLVNGGEFIREMSWDAVGGIMHRGGTVIGTARCKAFYHREGRRDAAFHLVESGIDRLVVIGGDGSLTAADLLRREWPELLAELVEADRLSQAEADRHPHLAIVGLVGSIDNDMVGTDMTIGADTALHRITEAVDALAGTAASHQRTFVVEVMGRRCGYLAVAAALAGGADWVLLPERPPEREDWEVAMVESLRAGREAGRRDSIVIVAEGARNRRGRPITAEYVRDILEHHLDEEVRLTILGHVQRGGRPSAFDRTMSSLLGLAAVDTLIAADPEDEAQLIGLRANRIHRSPLMACVEENRRVGEAIEKQDYRAAMEMRGSGFSETVATLDTMIRALPRPPKPGQRRLRLAVLNAGGPSPGMNTAVRVAVRFGLDRGHTVLGIRNGFPGLIGDTIDELGWMSVKGWGTIGGSELGTSRHVPEEGDLEAIARTLGDRKIDALLCVGGWEAYRSAHLLVENREEYKAFNLPIVCLPASIDNNLPGSELAVGADTALNSIVDALDKIKQSAVASRRCFVVEVMGRYCGYLALMAGLASGAERVYMHEEGVTLDDLKADVDRLVAGFEGGKRLGLMIRNEFANDCYTTQFMVQLFEEEGGELFDVRQAILGHLQQGGDPTPFDRNLAARLAGLCVERMVSAASSGTADAVAVGLRLGDENFIDLRGLTGMIDADFRRPSKQWWMDLRPQVSVLAQPSP
ncbi:MAG: 6-phosphofructokinase [Acidobacteria bacterium]|nr:6-phosphofructokinase [Acidobacteriota bacterium]